MLKQEWRASKTWVMIGMLLLGLVMSGTALAGQPVGPLAPPPRGESLLTSEDRATLAQIFWHRTQERLGLTDQQAADIRALLETQRTAARADVKNLMAVRRQLRTLLGQQAADPAAIQAVATQVKELQTKLFDGHLQTQLALRAKLTAEQWQGWLALRKGAGHHQMRRGHAFGPGAL